MLRFELGSVPESSGEQAGASGGVAMGSLFDELVKILPRETPGGSVSPSAGRKFAAESVVEEGTCPSEPVDEAESELASEHDVEEGASDASLAMMEFAAANWESYPWWLSHGIDPASLLAREHVIYEWDPVSATLKEHIETSPLSSERLTTLSSETKTLLHREGFGHLFLTTPERSTSSSGTESQAHEGGTSTSTPGLKTPSAGSQSPTHEGGISTTPLPLPPSPSSHISEEAAIPTPSPAPAKLSKGQHEPLSRADRDGGG